MLVLFSLVAGLFYMPLYIMSWILFIGWNYVLLNHVVGLPFLSQPEIFTGLLSLVMVGGLLRSMLGKEDLTTQGLVKD